MKSVHRHALRNDICIDIEGTFNAKIEVSVTPDIAIDRHLHMRRDTGGGWLIYSIPNDAVESGGDIASGDITVEDPAVCRFLDTFYYLIADPASFGREDFPAPPDTRANDAA